MPRIEPPRAEEAPPVVLPMWERFWDARGSVPNMFRTLSLRPDMALAVAGAMQAILNTGTVDLRLKEMVAVRVSQLNGCRYWLASHSALLRNLGVSQDVIDHLDDDAAREKLPAREQAVLRLAEQTTHDAKRVSDEQWNELRQFFAPEEIMELVAVAGLFAFFNRFNDALQVDITEPGWPGNTLKIEH